MKLSARIESLEKIAKRKQGQHDNDLPLPPERPDWGQFLKSDGSCDRVAYHAAYDTYRASCDKWCIELTGMTLHECGEKLAEEGGY
ncbi:TPA: hypothetical protein ACIPUI_000905 [Citrobacter freundii]